MALEHKKLYATDLLIETLETEQDRSTIWAESAICKGLSSDFYTTSETRTQQLRQQFCSRCPVLYDCAYYALITKEEYGIWGGLNESERWKLMRRVVRKHGSVWREFDEDSKKILQQIASQIVQDVRQNKAESAQTG